MRQSLLAAGFAAIFVVACGDGGSLESLNSNSSGTEAQSESTDFSTMFAQVRSGVVRIEAPVCNDEVSVGTGFLVDPHHVVTAAHVVLGSTSIDLSTDDSRGSGTLVALDEASDLAMIRADAPLGGWIFEFAVDDPQIGSEVIAVGYPLGLPLSLSAGRVSAVERTFDDLPGASFLQTDTELNPGNSGGPLLDSSGSVVGIVDWGISDANGLSFAIAGTSASSKINGWLQEGPTRPIATDCPEPATPDAPVFTPPEAPWDRPAVAASADLSEVVESLRLAESSGYPLGCSLFAPSTPGSEVGLEPWPFNGTFTRIGDFQFGWDATNGSFGFFMSIWPTDNFNVEHYFSEDPEGTEYADGSVVRASGDGRLIAIPGEDCFYELFFFDAPMTVYGWAFDSLRRIDY